MSEQGGELETGLDAIVETATPAESWETLQSRLQNINGHLVLVIVPDMGHGLVEEATGGHRKTTLAKITPDMPDNARRSVAADLRARQVDLLFVTPERFKEQRFVQFMRELAPRLLVVVSAQRACGDEFDYCPSYDILRTLRGLFADASLLALVDSPCTDAIYRTVSAGFGLRIAPKSAPTHSPEPAGESASRQRGAPAATGEDGNSDGDMEDHGDWAQAFPLFEQGKTLFEVANGLGQDPDWCIEAVVRFIRHTRRTNPFPWVDKPSYLAVAMVAGQAESNDLKVVTSILGEGIPYSSARIALAALQNRARGGTQP